MKRIFALGLLLFNGVGACFGGYHLVTDPSGGSLQMPIQWLDKSPFTDFYFPGLILFWLLGTGSLLVFILTLLKIKSYYIWIVFIGSALFIWIITQILMVQKFHWLQLLLGSVGLLLVLTGVSIRKDVKKLQYKN